MGKDKLKKFAENKTFRCLVQPEFDEIFGKDHPLKGRWHADFFRNDRPIVLELGCAHCTSRHWGRVRRTSSRKAST